ncbi:hypothetical protein ACEWY4_008554 [Coilia grayii]|uniref:Myb/SANT-like DNA-binding domain-containing protein n=1 Tax=Coilia grayii TaxID=363190 RepID=A0ABD1KBK2_9TELE
MEKVYSLATQAQMALLVTAREFECCCCEPLGCHLICQRAGVAMSDEKRNNWSRAETLLFLNVLREADVVSALDRKRQRNADIFKKIATVLSRRGVDRNWEALRNKWKTMKGRYLAEKRASGKSGAEGKINYEFWEEMDMIMGSRPVVTAANEATVDSGTGKYTAMETDGDMDIPDTPDTITPESLTPVTPGGSLFRRPLKRKVTPAQQLNEKLSEMMAQHERQEERDREMLQSIVSPVNRLVDCIERQQTTSAFSQQSFPYPHPQPGPSTYQSFLYMQHQQQNQQQLQQFHQLHFK